MTENNDDWNNGNNDGANNTPKALRDHAENLKKQLDEANAEKAKLAAQVRTNTITGVLSSKGFNPKIATIIPEGIEPTEEKLTEWLSQHADIFAPASTAGSQGGNEPPKEDPDEDHANDDRMGRAMSQGLPLDRAKDVEARIAAAKTPEDMDKVMGELSHVRFK